MDAVKLDQWVRKQTLVTNASIRRVLRVKHVGGSTWQQVARILIYHGFERIADGWERKRPSPAAPCPTYRQLQKAATERRARCRAALLAEQKKDSTKYEPIHRDASIQDPGWVDKAPGR